MEHRGEIIEQAIRKSGIPIVTIAKKMGKSRRWLYLLFENPQVSLDIVEQIGKIIYHDFADEIQPLKSFVHAAEDATLNYHLKEIADWKDKYFKLMEEHHELLKKVALLEQKIANS